MGTCTLFSALIPLLRLMPGECKSLQFRILHPINPLDMVLWRLVILTSLKFFSEFKKAFYLQETRLHKGANSFIKAAL
jgi:hypothetical protein